MRVTGGAHEYLPHDFAPWQTVYGYFRRWRQQGVWKKIHDRLVRRVRVAVLPKRWIVERTLGWLVKNRRLRGDYEQLPATSEALIYVAMIRLMLGRLHPQK